MAPSGDAERLPPGQVYARNWVIYAALGVPHVDVQSWRLHVTGMVKNRLEFTYEQLQGLPLKRYVRDFSCVTRWSIGDVVWEGVPIRVLAERAEAERGAAWVMFHCADGYTAPVPAEDALADDSIIVLRMNGKPLTLHQGFPARPFIPQLYGWKSAKWLTEVEFMQDYVDGYWEMYGYHERANIWEEERFKGSTGRHTRRTSLGIVPTR